MFETWVLPTLILMVGVVLLIAAVLAVGTSTRRVVWKSFWCPLKKLHVTVGFLADRFRRDRYCDVLSCSAFAAPWQVGCDKRCLNLPEAYNAPTADAAGETPEYVRGGPPARGDMHPRGLHRPRNGGNLAHGVRRGADGALS